MKKKSASIRKRGKFRLREDEISGYLFIGVAMVVFLAFTVYPLISAIITSFQNYKPFGSTWVKFENYETALSNKLFWKACRNTLIYTALTVPMSLVIAFMVALMILPFKKKTQSFFKSLYYIPAVASAVVTSMVWIWIYDSSGAGLFNQLLTFFHLPTQQWLTSSKTAMLSLVLMSLLSGNGSSVIIYIAALMGIDNTYFEAAEVDGATFLQKVRYIVLPLCKPTTLFLLITGVINSFQVFINAYMMTGGGPDNNTTMIGLLIFNNAFKYGKYGLACAQAILLTILIAVMNAIQFKVAGDDVEY